MKKQPITLKEVLLDIIENSNNNRQEINKIRKIWTSLIVKDGRSHLSAYKYENETLYILADGPDWATYAKMEANNIKETISRELNIKIEKVNVRLKFFKDFIVKNGKKIKLAKQLKNADINKIKKNIKDKDLFGYLLYEFYKKNKGEK